MKYRNILICILLLLALLPLTGCGAGRGLFASPTPVPTPSPVPTPTPAPTPVPVIALWGAEDAPVFAREVQRAVERVGYRYTALIGDEDALLDFPADGAAGVIACCVDGAPERLRTRDTYYCMLGGGEVPPGCHGVRYDGATAVEKAFAEIVAYPPHCEPVRMLGLFAAEDSAAYTAYFAARDAGTFLSRGAYVASEKKSAGDWLADKLDDIYPGMLDGIFAETGELAAEAAEALSTLSRSDAEIFCASTSGTVLEHMQSAPALVVCAVGYMPEAVAETCVNNAILSIIGETPVDATALPETFLTGGATAP